MSLLELQPPKSKRVPLIKPQSSGLVERCLVVGGGLAVVYTFSATLPIASCAALVAIGSYFWGEIKNFQPREVAEELHSILNAKTPRHPSINDLRSVLRAKYPTEAINAAIKSMLGQTESVEFRSSSNHPLACFGEAYCWVNPDDPTDVKLPLERIDQLLKEWGIIAAVDVRSHSQPSDQTSPVTAAPTANTAPLVERLKAECPELLHLIKSPPIRLVGLQRTGKSSFARKLALLRLLLLPGHSVVWATPHLERDNPLPAALNPIGFKPSGAKDFGAIESCWSGIQTQIDQGVHPNKTVVWDEFGSYDSFENLELLGASLRSLLRESSKHEYYPVIIAHGDQTGFYPGITGILTTLKNSTVKVETVGAIADHFGTMRPTGEVKVYSLTGEVKQFKLPDWLTEDYLLSLLAGNGEQPPQPVSNSPTDEPEDRHIVKEVESRSLADTLQKRVGLKLAEKLKASSQDWVSLNALIRDNFTGNEDRETARQLIKIAIARGKVEFQERENSNKTKSVLIRIPPTSTNRN